VTPVATPNTVGLPIASPLVGGHDCMRLTTLKVWQKWSFQIEHPQNATAMSFSPIDEVAICMTQDRNCTDISIQKYYTKVCGRLTEVYNGIWNLGKSN